MNIYIVIGLCAVVLIVVVVWFRRQATNQPAAVDPPVYPAKFPPPVGAKGPPLPITDQQQADALAARTPKRKVKKP